MSETSLATNTNLVIQLILTLVLIYGYVLFRSGKIKLHSQVTAFVTGINLLSILFSMLPRFLDESEHILENPFGVEAILLTSHHLLGLIAEVLALYSIYKWWKGDCKGKMLMRSILLSWIVSSLIGIYLYLNH